MALLRGLIPLYFPPARRLRAYPEELAEQASRRIARGEITASRFETRLAALLTERV